MEYFGRAKTAKEMYANSQEDGKNKTEGMVNQVDTYSASGVGSTRDTNYCTTPATSLTTSTASAASPCVVVETYRDGASWCRVWSDGWIEQGGIAAAGASVNGNKIDFIKSYTDTNYTITTSGRIGTRTTASSFSVTITQKNTSNFYASSSFANSNTCNYQAEPYDWYACGY